MKKLLLIIILAASALISRAQSKNVLLEKDIVSISAHADTLFAHQDYEHAYTAYNHLVEYQPKNAKAYRRMGYIQANSVNGAADAIELFKKAIVIDKTDAVSYYYLGTVYIDLAKKTNDSKVKAQNKALAETNLKLAVSYGSEDAKGAIEDLNGI
jgi:tetratricopeptide (TPR) repeat protein